MSEDPFTPAELEAAESAALDNVVPFRGHLQPWRTILRAVLDSVAPLIAARVRADVAEEIAQVADAYALRLHGTAAAVMREGAHHAAAIVRAHRTTPGDDHADR